MQPVAKVRAWGHSSTLIWLFFNSLLNKIDLSLKAPIPSLQENEASSVTDMLKIACLKRTCFCHSLLFFQFHLLFLSFSFFLSPRLSHLPPTHSLSLSPAVFTHHSVTLTLSPCWLCPSLCSSTHFFHGFFGCLFALSSLLLLLLLKPRDAAHLTAVAVNRARLSPCVAATAAVNLVQTRCLFYSLALSRGREKEKGEAK